MGSQSSRNQVLVQRHIKFLKVFKNNYKLNSEINDEIFGHANLYENINNQSVEVMEKLLSISQQPQIQKVIKTMEMRITHPHPNLIRIYKNILWKPKVCQGLQRVFEEEPKELTQQTQEKWIIPKLIIMYIIKYTNLLNGITYLHEQKTFHGQIRAQTILVDISYHLKLVQRALLSPSNWQIVAAQGSGYKILKGKGVLPSPCILQCLKQKTTQMANYDPFKADIFALGMILLQCCSLKKAEDFYDYDNLEVKTSQIQKVIYQCRRKYSHKLMNFVQKMLQFEDQTRPHAKTLMQKMQVISGDTIRQMNTTLNQSFLNQTILSYL